MALQSRTVPIILKNYFIPIKIDFSLSFNYMTKVTRIIGIFSRTETIPTAEPEINMEIGSIDYPTNGINSKSNKSNKNKIEIYLKN